MLARDLVWVRGAGELGSAVAHLLHRVGLSVILSEISPPLAIRRPVTFSDALIQGETEVEGITAKRVTDLSQIDSNEFIPLLEDDPDQILALSPDIIVDARMKKKVLQDYQHWSRLFIGLGPGFQVGTNCHLAIETMRGHDLGRIISSGAPHADTGVPGKLGGETSKRLIRANRSGRVIWTCRFGECVKKGQRIGMINQDKPILAPLDGMVRGMISEKTPVTKGMKIGDIDPRGEEVQFKRISEKSRLIASGVLEAIILHQEQGSK